MYGVYKSGEEIHIIQCDKDGQILKPHKESMDCACRPYLEERGEDGTPIINHLLLW